MNKEKLNKEVWSKDSYYKIAREGSADFDHPAMKKLAELASDASVILDMGCGEGTRLYRLVGKTQKGYGVDISSKAVEMAQKQYPQFNFKVGDLENLPFPDETFDLVYSAFVFEHLDNPEKVIKEAIRVLKPKGTILVVAPNFGAPNRASPPFRGSRLAKLLSGFFRDFFPGKNLSWRKVTPIADAKKYEVDWDTTIEPYVGSFVRFLRNKGLKIKFSSSSWFCEAPNVSTFQKIIRKLGEAGIYPFSMWGPHLYVIAQK